MDNDTIKKAISELKAQIESKKRKFSQAVDLVIVLRPSTAKAKAPVDLVVSLPNKVREVSTCAFVDKDMSVQSAQSFSKVILKDDFPKYDKKTIRKLIKETDYFFAEATIMPQMAAKFGKQLTAANKMPNPKTGTIINPTSNLGAAAKNVGSLIRVNTAKNNAVLVKVGSQDWDESKLVENVNVVYSSVKSALPEGEQRIKHTYLKLTMGKPVAI